MATKNQEANGINRVGSNGRVQNVSRQAPRALTNCQRLCYGVGHVFNDLTASMWFSYMLIYMHKVIGFDNILAGNLILIGQISDGLFTPFVGVESDRTHGFLNFGKRKSWHLVGTLCVMASFSFLFNPCINCSHAPMWSQFIYYAPFIVIFQFGWASVQISHLSFSSDYSPHTQERVTLQSIRNSFTVIANVTVFTIFWLLFYLGKTAQQEDNSDLSEADSPKFRDLAFICVGIGFVFNMIFHLGTKEKKSSDILNDETTYDPSVGEDNSLETSALLKARKMSWKDWLTEYQFYQVAVMYMCIRLYINVSQIYFAMYLTESLKFEKSAIALLPLVTYCSGFVMSFASSYINMAIGRKLSYCLGLLIGLCSSLWMYFIPDESPQVYGSAVLLGAAGSLLLITSLSMTSDLIGSNTESGAFVFGAMSFTDKVSNGLAVIVIQAFQPCSGCCAACKPYYRLVQSFIPGGALIFGFIFLLTIARQTIGTRRTRAPDLKAVKRSYTETQAETCVPVATSSCGIIPRYTVDEPQLEAVYFSNRCDDKDDYYEKKLVFGNNKLHSHDRIVSI